MGGSGAGLGDRGARCRYRAAERLARGSVGSGNSFGDRAIEPLLHIRDLNIKARQPSGALSHAVRDVSLEVKPGEVVAVIGQSGAGKSTVALAALGYIRSGMFISSGSVLLEGRDLVPLNRAEKANIRGRLAAYVAQSAQAALDPAMHIGTQIAESLKIHRLTTAVEARKIALNRLEDLDLPDPGRICRSYPHQLSGGQQQRAMIAMAMACNPKLLVLDEPTTALDVTTQIEVLKALKHTIRRGGAAALYVSHDLAVVAQIADRILVMHHGELVESGTTDDVIGNPQAAETKALLASTRRSMPAAKPPGRPAAVTLLKVDDLTASYVKPGLFQKPNPLERCVLKGVSLSLEAHETLAVVGESGSGKSTLARVIAGLHRPQTGSVQLREARLPPLAKERTIDQLRRIQIVFQSPDQSINPETRVFDAISRPMALYFKMPPAEKRRASRRAPGNGGSSGLDGGSLSTRTLWRSAAESCDCKSLGGQARSHSVRRIPVLPGRYSGHADPGTNEEPAEGDRRFLPLHKS